MANINYTFNWEFLLYIVICSVLTLFFLLYFNRLFASVVSYGIRTWTWHQYRVHLDIQAIQISLLAGRIFFKGIKYHGNNETILIHSGYATWCYWLRNVRDVDIRRGKKEANRSSSDTEDARTEIRAEQGGTQQSSKLPCRINIVLRGAEWFVYNRSPAYDSVLEGLTKVGGNTEATNGLRKRKIKEEVTGGSETPNEKDSLESGKHLTNVATDAPEVNIPTMEELEDSFYLRMLPIHLECTKAAIVMGNENTKSVLVGKFERVSGEIDASSAGPLDQYRQLFNFNFEHPIIKMQPNDDFKEDQATMASHLKSGSPERTSAPPANFQSLFHRYRRRAWHQLQDLVPYFRSSVESLSTTQGDVPSTATARDGAYWQGLSRYLDEEEQDDRARWAQVEYAMVPEIIESKSASMNFYWDVPGTVPAQPGPLSDINGDEPPGYGVELIIRGATINYGPWADRQRADLQRVFLPYLCKDAIQAEKLKPGQLRVMTVFKLYLQLDDEATLRIPIREDSKNWKWKKQADTAWQENTTKSRPGRFARRKRRANKPLTEARAFGWLDIKVGPNATVTHVMDMVAGPHGFSNIVELDLPSAEISTSVNHSLLWRSVDARVTCDLSNPLKWNALRTWTFKIFTTGLELFLLREHVFLLIDLSDDWSSGPPAEFLTFTPFKYMIDLNFENFRLYLNANDSNIINNPCDFDDNTFLIIFGAVLKAGITIPLEFFRPSLNAIPFKVTAEDCGLNLHVPPWNTQASFLASTEIAQLPKLAIDGKYQYNATTSPTNTDTLLMDVYGKGPAVELYGFIIRYLMVIRANYFGQDIHFKTLEEYQQLLVLRQEDPQADLTGGQPHKKSNDLDVILSVTIDEPAVILPSNLYKAKNNIRVEVPIITMDLRFTNYYMDLDVMFSTLSGSLVTEDEAIYSSVSATSATQLFIDGVKIHGHRLFGLPPTEPTYVCNWDFAVGAITGECSTDFLRHFAAAGKGLGFTFDDDENALPSISEELLNDITFLRATVEPVKLWLHVEDRALLLSTGAIRLGFDDWAGSHYSKKLKLSIPDIVIACVDAESASRHRLRTDHEVETHAYIQTSISLGIIMRKKGFTKEKLLQQEHIYRHDQRTHRTDFLLLDELNDLMADIPRDVTLPPAMPVPPMPWPLAGDVADQSSSLKSSIKPSRQRLRRQSSFISLDSVSTASLRSNGSVVRSRSTQQINRLSTSKLQSKPARSRERRDVSSESTGRQSSFYSIAGDFEEKRNLAPSSTAFSSPYISPYFPLQFIAPNSKDLPDWQYPARLKRPATPTRFTLSDFDPQKLDEDEVLTSFIIEFRPGIRAFINPDAVHAVADLLSGMSEVQPDDMLDALQISSLTEIFDLNKQSSLSKTTTEFHIRIPEVQVRFVNSATSPASAPNGQNDQYDLSLSSLAISSRSGVERLESQRDNLKNTSSIHLGLDLINLSAKERLLELENPQAAVNARVEEIVFWLKNDEEMSANANIRSIEVATVSCKIEYLASLLHRTAVMGQEIGNTFSALSKEQSRRLVLFTCLVTEASASAPDPLFLTRPSYVLRSAPNHLRLKDSWKIITRLRHMYGSLDARAKQKVLGAIYTNNEVCPPTAAQRVVESFNNWRGWDLENAASSFTMQKIFGKAIEPQKPSFPVKLSIKTRTLKLLLDPGPKQNEITLATMLLNVSIEDVLGSKGPVSETKIQVYCVDAGISLNWELLELANDVLKLVQDSEKVPPKATVSSAPTLNRYVQIVIATETGSITLDSINARSISVSKGLKTSLILDENNGELGAHFLISASAGRNEVRSRAQTVLISQLLKPSIYVSYVSQIGNDTITKTWKAAGYCTELCYEIQQDTLALLEIADRFIGDEVSQIYSLQSRLPKKRRPATPTTPSTPGMKIVSTVNVALFLDKYQISIPLLQSLSYTISGKVARGSIASRPGTELVFDFDIKQHHHNMRTDISGKSQSISVLKMPPTNGRVSLHSTESDHSVSVFASTELVKLDAKAIHSLTSALNRPEISSVITEIKKEIKLIQEHVEDVFGPSEPQAPKVKKDEVSKEFIYDANFTFQGLDISADAPGTKKGREKARLEFKLGSLQIKAANRIDPQGPILPFPEIHVGLRHIMFELSRLNNGRMETCGNFAFAAFLTATSKKNEYGDEVRSYHLRSDGLEINLFAETASTVVDVLNHFQETIKDVDLTRERQYLRKLSKPTPRITISDENDRPSSVKSDATTFFASLYSLELLNIQVSWVVGASALDGKGKEDLVLSVKRINFSTRKENTAKLTIEDFQLQMVPPNQKNKVQRSLNSALLPEVIFNVGYVSSSDARRLAFQAAGKSLDLRLTSHFIIPATHLRASLATAMEKVRAATATWSKQAPQPTEQVHEAPKARQPQKLFFGRKRMESLLVDADFAGATVYLSGKKLNDPTSPTGGPAGQSGRYAQFAQEDANNTTVLRSPGLAFNVEYQDDGSQDPSLNAEVKVDASSNILYPTVVPLFLEISAAIKEMVEEENQQVKTSKPADSLATNPKSAQKLIGGEEENFLTADPSAVLGRTRLNMGLRILKQEFSLSCQPIARVAATARFDSIYLTINTVRSTDHGHFFAASAVISNVQTSVQHVYSREATGSFDVDSVVLSLMNSKHLSGINGLSAILNISPMKVLVNVKQLQDFLLFREIWLPDEIRQRNPAPEPQPQPSQTYLVQRYQEVSATGTFPWNATVSIAELNIALDLGQSIGKSDFTISKFWVSSKKSSDWEQNLCLAFEQIGIVSTGRMSGAVELQNFKVRTSIEWPPREEAVSHTPLIQASLGFSQLRVNASFDYQPFIVADITSFDFMMYNIHSTPGMHGDCLVAVLDGEAVQVFCTTNTASQALALYQALQKLVQEKQTNYETSLRDVEKYIKRKGVSTSPSPQPLAPISNTPEKNVTKSPISLFTRVVVTLKALNIGAFPNTFHDHQIFKMEASNAQARFSVAVDDGKVHSALGLTLGQLRIALAGVREPSLVKVSGDISVDEVIKSATGSRGGTILKVPELQAIMQTWQTPNSNHIDYIFKSYFEGKVEVGWNYSRISFIRNMWASHSKALALRLGKPLPPSAVKITGVPGEEGDGKDDSGKDREQQKITAEVNVPQSKYEYTALEPPVIETPQLRDMGEATPPLEWIGLHRDRLPNLTHQIVIVTLLEIASEVEDAYEKILGTS